jgi:hypothetical protein
VLKIVAEGNYGQLLRSGALRAREASGGVETGFSMFASSRLKSARYPPMTVFDSFHRLQSPTKKRIDAVAAAAVEVRRVRAAALKVTTGGLRAVYRTLELPGKHPLKDAHTAPGAAVLAAYGFDPKKDLLAQLLGLNSDVAAREKQNLPVTAPGVPPTYGDPAPLVTEDCIRP